MSTISIGKRGDVGSTLEALELALLLSATIGVKRESAGSERVLLAFLLN